MYFRRRQLLGWGVLAVAALLGGATRPTGQPAARGVYGHDPSIAPYPYDPAAAKKLLAEAGFADGFSFALDAAIGVDANDADCRLEKRSKKRRQPGRQR